jgi:hypothetical protein
LFNVFLPGNDPSHQKLGVPKHHSQLRLNAPNLPHKCVEGTREFFSSYVTSGKRYFSKFTSLE